MRSAAALVVLGAVAAASGARAAEYHYLEVPAAPSRWVPGQLRCGATPAGWQGIDADDRLLLAPSDGGISDGSATEGCDVLRIRRRFDAGPEAERLATLTLRARYRDGLVAWLNGVEIARRRLAEGSPLADETHGPEPERFVVPLGPGMLRAGHNVLAVEVRAARANRVPSAELSLDGTDRIRILRGPYLQRVLDGEASLMLATDLPSRVAVRYRPAGSPDAARSSIDGEEREARSPSLGTEHTVRLTGLRPGTTYTYHVSATVAGFAAGVAPSEMDAAFHTPPPSDRPLRIALFGDVRSGHDVHEQIARAVMAEDPDLALLTGDLVDRGTDEGDWERFFDVAAPLLRQVAVYPAIGNHEYGARGRGLGRFLSYFPHPTSAAGGLPDGSAWWSFDIAGVHFVCLDSEAMRDPDQLAWLERDLKAADARRPRAIFAYDHDGPWSSQMHGDNPIAIRDYAPLLEKYRVTMVFGGHDHDYERGRVGSLDYLVSGGGGAELRIPRCGVPGRPRCGSRVKAFANEHHYVMIDVFPDRIRVCPKRADGTLLEPCPTLPVRR